MARRLRLKAFILLPAIALTLAACGGSNGGTTASGIPIVAKGKLTTCTHLPYQPFQVKQGDKIVGFDVDLVDLVAKKLGVEQNIVDISFETIQSGEAMNSGQCDVAAAGMTITDIRKQKFDFSDPYFEATQALLVKKGSTITSLDNVSGKKIGVQSGTTGADYTNAHAKGAEIITFDDLALEEQAVKNGTVDAGVNDNGVLYDFVKSNPDTAVSAEFKTNEFYGIGVKKGSTALLTAINDTLKTAVQDGTYAQIYQKWFGKAPTWLPGGVTAPAAS